ncbi:GNAT family N-acetyltransferase [Janthinobacterium sp. B9-8]|uniref:GNAT family N-acetyltransferase n=1 Tax=Janthinobacterium sp. B9-8 TaxID=1236179 RepID=UPI00061CF6A7|nr:GNAT family N-acetyltransferase [Janthinobacterium sp. B9-8]AMC33394.1 GNAT family acetyltransferase [Janthinobacterium sp. B9-8]
MRRLAELSDLEPVFFIYMNAEVIHFLGFDPMPIEAFKPIFYEFVESRCFFVYEVSGELAGFYKASRHPGRASHVAYLGSLAVAPKFQGQGIAQIMVEEAIEELCRLGAKRIELIVESDNTRGLSFYTRLGFEIEGKLRKFYKRSHESTYVDDYIMSKIFD